MNMSEEMVEVAVRNISGQAWNERWTREKLAYFILMCTVDAPKFERSQAAEWVPYDCNEYKWDKSSLPHEEFERIAARWPGRNPVPFNPADCDRVEFNYEVNDVWMGVGFNPPDEPQLFDALCKLGRDKMRYEEFFYPYARHVFVLDLSPEMMRALLATGLSALLAVGRIHPSLLRRMTSRSVKGIEARFLCREGSFEPPFQMWYET